MISICSAILGRMQELLHPLGISRSTKVRKFTEDPRFKYYIPKDKFTKL